MHDWPKIVLLGDSITQYSFDENGWGAYISNLVQRKCDVLNRGFSGYTTEFILRIMNKLIDINLVKNAVAVTIFYGANDSGLLEFNQRQHVPLAKYENNLGKIIDRFLELGVDSDQIIVISPPPVDEKAWLEATIQKGNGNYCDRSNSVVENYANACKKISSSKNCRFVNLYSEMIAEEDFQCFLSDGLHLSVKGNRFLGKLLEKHVLELTDLLPTLLPLWKDFPLD